MLHPGSLSRRTKRVSPSNRPDGEEAALKSTMMSSTDRDHQITKTFRWRSTCHRKAWQIRKQPALSRCARGIKHIDEAGHAGELRVGVGARSVLEGLGDCDHSKRGPSTTCRLTWGCVANLVATARSRCKTARGRTANGCAFASSEQIPPVVRTTKDAIKFS